MRDHPRVCGEKSSKSLIRNAGEGSPPRMRGKAPVQAGPYQGTGITPAYAGKRMIIVPVGETHEDHPRVCGEKPSRRRSRRHRGGSPPRMRGKVTSSRRRIGAAGITPAYAGKSRLLAFELCGLKDHPRVCGEKCQPGPRSPGWAGSPPRMRGKARQAVYKDIKHGITPAYAGKRLKRSHSIGHFSCILCLFHSVLHRASASGGSRAGPCAPPCLTAQNAVPV